MKYHILRINTDYSFSLTGEWKYKGVIQPKTDKIKLLIENKEVIFDIFRLSLIAFYRINLPLKELEKISFVKHKSNIVKIDCGYLPIHSELISHGCPNNFYLIPGFYNYAINKKGVVINLNTGRYIKEIVDPYGYIGFNMFNVNKGKINQNKQHVLLARTFIKNDDPLNKNLVNHKNSVKEDNRLENLEWCTPKENMQHAIMNGAKNHLVQPVELRDIYTNEVRKFSSRAEACRFLNYGTGLPSHIRIVNGKQIPILLRRRYEMRHCDSGVNWYYTDKSKLKMDSIGPFEIRNSKTGKVVRYASLVEIADYLNVKEGRVYTANATDGKRLLVGYQIRKASDKPWPTETYESCDNTKKDYTLFNIISQNIVEMKSKSEIAKFLCVTRATVRKAINENSVIKEWKIFQIPSNKFSLEMVFPRPL